MIDDDAIRDQVVARTAHRQCCACGATENAISVVLGFRGDLRVYSCLGEPTTVTRVFDGKRMPALRRHDYPWCGVDRCSDWLEVQELLGRLPHQVGVAPRAAWREDAQWRVWELWVGSERMTEVVQVGPDQWVGRISNVTNAVGLQSLAAAQASEEIEVVRALRVRTTTWTRTTRQATWTRYDDRSDALAYAWAAALSGRPPRGSR